MDGWFFLQVCEGGYGFINTFTFLKQGRASVGSAHTNVSSQHNKNIKGFFKT